MVILASASPRRQQLLKLAVSEFKVIPSDAEEAVPADMPLDSRPEFLACKKSSDIARQYPDDLVIGADTSVIVKNTILGKPADAKAAEEMLRLLSGKVHRVVTGCAVIKNGVCKSFSVSTNVEFYSLSCSEISDYIATGEPFDKAGGYGIQSLGALFVKQIDGDYYNVVGLPVAPLSKFIKQNFGL